MTHIKERVMTTVLKISAAATVLVCLMTAGTATAAQSPRSVP
jgi:hypothetical protein